MEHLDSLKANAASAEQDDQADGGESTPKGPIALKDISPEVAALGVTTFADLPLHPSILEAVATIGWVTPTPVQKLCLPYSLRGRDVAGFAQTGTGKTGVFLITILNKLLSSAAAADQTVGRVPRAIVIAPTRELAMQSEQDAAELFARTGIKSVAVFGGVDYDKQARDIKDGVDVIFATPGRLKDYIQKKVISLADITCFVCDEADRMFDMGFIEDVEFFLDRIPETAQRLLFSATTNEQVKELAFEYLENPEYISVNPETITPEKIEMHALHCHATDKLKVILGLLQDHNPECSIIFTNTKLTAEWLHFKLLHNGIEADLISGDLPQSKRISLIHRIKEGKIKALVATDVASRGLHISRVTHVYNFDLPDDASNYVHRVGRTARAGAKGYAYSLVCDDYGQNLAAINDLLGPLALHTTWPDVRYLSLVDKAGNPFEERYAARRERSGEASFGAAPRRGDHGPRGHDRGGPDRGRPRGATERPQRQGADGGQQTQGESQRGPREHRIEQDRGSRPSQRPGARPNPRPGQGPSGHAGQGPSGHAQSGDAGDKKKRRRRGRKGGDGETRNEANANNQGQQRSPHQGQHGRDRHAPREAQHSNRQERPGHQSAAHAETQHDAAPKTMGGMIKKLVKTIFGLS